ncbi:hypothetical protein [uncultured Novosphingobium sp.]|uniref:hypothetical protein n=1 Tax=uncultured Novosphingobium sp. TaxID=292277 RepID=UPI00374A626B
MDFDDQLSRYFGTADMEAIAPPALASGIERMGVDLGMEQDRGRRFALWSLMYLLGAAPDLDAVFKKAEDRDAAWDFMDLMDKAAPE